MLKYKIIRPGPGPRGRARSLAVFRKAILECKSEEMEKLEKHFKRFYSVDLLDPKVLRSILLQIYNEFQWKTALPEAEEIRRKRVFINGKEYAFFMVMHLYCVEKYNTEIEGKTGFPSRITLKDMQRDGDLKSKLKINTSTLKEMLGRAGLKCHPALGMDLSDMDLLSGVELKKFFNNAYLDGRKVVFSSGSMKILDLRRVALTHPDTGITVKCHTLMVYYTCMKRAKETGQDRASMKEACSRGMGQSSLKVMQEMLVLAGVSR